MTSVVPLSGPRQGGVGAGLSQALSPAQAQPQPGVGFGTPGASAGISDYSNLWNLATVANLPQSVATDNRIAGLYNQVGLSGALSDLQRSTINQQAGFDRERLSLNRALLGDQGQELGARRGDIDYWHNRQTQQFIGGQAARGATHTLGTTRGLADFENEKARLLRQVGMDERQLARTARNLGIQEQELASRVQSALDQLGLSQAMTITDIFGAIQDAEAGRFNPLQNMLGMIYQLSGIRPVAASTTTPTTTPTPTTTTPTPRPTNGAY